MDATKAAQYGFDAAIDEVMHGGASVEALDKEHRAYVKLDTAKEEERQACQGKTNSMRSQSNQGDVLNAQ